jgi:hypothetical protein
MAQHAGWRVAELPVRWAERRDSRVRIWPTAMADLQGLIRLRRRLARGYAGIVPALRA